MKFFKEKIKDIKKENIEIVALIIFIIIMAVIVGRNRITLSNFNPINGDFQNYNPVRRFLEGQVPFKDFAVYLGTGHLILLSVIQILVGNNFTMSLLGSNMMTMLIFELTVFVISFLVLKNKRQALYTTLALGLINIIRPYSITSILNDEFIRTLNFGIAPGNSARLIRMAILPIIALLVYIGIKFIEKSKNNFINKNENILKKVWIAILGGISILWSNDGGVATYVSISFIYFLWLIKEHKKNVKFIIRDTFLYIGISAFTFFILLGIITRGNILSWFEFNFGVASYQRWYYEEAPGKKNISLFDLDINVYSSIMIVVAIYYVYKIFKTKENVMKYGLLALCVITPILSSCLYQMASGGISREMLVLVLFILVLSYGIKILISMIKEKSIIRVLKVAIIIIACGTIINNVAMQLYEKKYGDKNAFYIEELGGYFTQYGDSIKLAMDRIGNEKIFSTYASAVETATGQFQPTGVDYIIHCLGDKQREEYLDVFKQGDFKYVATVDRDFNNYRYWIRNANWFFYRELYKDYVPTFVTEYNLFFEKAKDEPHVMPKAQVETSKLDDTRYKIQVTTEDKNFNGVADIRIAYHANFKKSFFKTLDINKYVVVDDITTKEIANGGQINYNIPNKSDGYYIPVTIVDGKGEVEVYSYPIDNSKLYLDKIEILSIYDVMFKYCAASRDKTVNENVIYIDNTNENKVILKNAKSIKIGDNIKNVVSFTEEEKFIKLELDSNAEEFAYPNCFEVIK